MRPRSQPVQRSWSSVSERRRADAFFDDLVGDARRPSEAHEALAEHQVAGAAVLSAGAVGPAVDGTVNIARIGLVSPSGALSGAATAAAVLAEINRMTPRFVADYRAAGHTVAFDLAPGEPSAPHASASYSFAGTAAQRFASLKWGLFDPATQAAMAIRGGHGAMRLLDELGTTIAAARFARAMLPFGGLMPPLFPAKRIVGYSDVTAVLLAVYSLLGWASLHGPMLSSPGDAASRTALVRAMTLAPSALYPGNIVQANLGLAGAAPPAPIRGVLLGGNLSLVDALYGSQYFPSLQGAILFVEEIDEEGRKIDRMLEALKQRGAATQAVAVVVGRTSSLASNVVAQLFRDSWGVPCVSGLTAGHGGTNLALWIGLEYELQFPAAGGATLVLRP